MNALFIIGRIFFVLLFLEYGLFGHIAQLRTMTQYAQSKELPYPKFAVVASGILLILGSVSILLGTYADMGALLLVLFLIPTAIFMHNFWSNKDAQARNIEQAAFFKDIGLAGAALLLYTMLHYGSKFGPHLGKLLLFKAH